MKNKKRVQGWIFRDEQGKPYELKVVTDKDVAIVGVSGTNEKTLKKLATEIYGITEWWYVDVLPD